MLIHVYSFYLAFTILVPGVAVIDYVSTPALVEPFAFGFAKPKRQNCAYQFSQ